MERRQEVSVFDVGGKPWKIIPEKTQFIYCPHLDLKWGPRGES